MNLRACQRVDYRPRPCRQLFQREQAASDHPVVRAYRQQRGYPVRRQEGGIREPASKRRRPDCSWLASIFVEVILVAETWLSPNINDHPSVNFPLQESLRFAFSRLQIVP